MQQSDSGQTLFASDIIDKKNRENFPVASWWMPTPQYEKLLAFYQFARGADDIADDPAISPEQKILMLKEVNVLVGQREEEGLPQWLVAYHRLVHNEGLTPEYGQLLLSAFTQDARKNRYEDWGELLDYCGRSAAPVGRAVLDFYNEHEANIGAADALCGVLQIINHLQDIKEDYVERNRVYFPVSWFEDVGALSNESANENVREAIDKAIFLTRKLMKRVYSLPPTVQDRRLRYQLQYIIEVADMLLMKLRQHDPLKGKIKLTFAEKLRALARAIKTCMQQTR